MTDTDHLAELADRIRPVHFAMFTTVDAHGHLISQPMTVQKADESGIWFYTSSLTELWENIAATPQVNLSFTKPDDHLFVSVSGEAFRVVDRALVHDMWNAMVQAWFPAGPEDEHAVLVRVEPHAAEYWDSDESAMVRLFHYAKAAMTGEQPTIDPAEHGKISV